jgi:hypothetical protein
VSHPSLSDDDDDEVKRLRTGEDDRERRPTAAS